MKSNRTVMSRILYVVVGAFLILPQMGCLPSRIAIDLDPEAPRLSEHILEADDGAGTSAPKIAMIRVEGLIADAPTPTVFGAGPNPVDGLVRRLERAAEDPLVKAVIIRINSPGGSVSGSEVMFDEVRRFSERSGKPVVASIGEIGASGGYYLALAADEIMAMPGSTTASIGVIFQTFNFSEGMSMIGISARSVTSGPNKSMGSPFEPEQEAHYEIIQEIVNEHYAAFSQRVRERRPGLTDADAAWATDGRVMTGMKAHSIGLVDSLGGVRESFEAAKNLADVEVAQLIAYDARSPSQETSPYWSVAENQPPMGSARAEINLTGLGLGSMHRLDPGFYFLWAPGAAGR